MTRIAALLSIVICGIACDSTESVPHRPAQQRPVSSKPPNVLLIVIDTLRADHLSSWNWKRPTTPRIDRLASTSVRYANAFSQAPWTTPSVGSLLTSLYPSELGITDEPNRLDDRFTLLSEVLQANGYETGAVVSHRFVNKRWNFQQGFDSFDQRNVRGHGGVCSPGVTRQAKRFLRKRDRSRPFFLFVHYFDPHFNYIEHEAHRFQTETEYSGSLGDEIRYHDIRVMKDLTAADLDKMLTVYDSEIAFTDHHIGELLDALARGDTFDDTLIVLTADHGEEFKDHGQFGHSRTLYNEAIHVPLLIKYPGNSVGRVVNEPVGLIDVFPTVLDYLEITATHRISGKSLRGGKLTRPVFSETSRFVRRRSVVANGHKMIWDKENDAFELYDLEADALEQTNLAETKGETVQWMKKMLMNWDLSQQSHEAGSVDFSDEDIRELKALGYLEQ